MLIMARVHFSGTARHKNGKAPICPTSWNTCSLHLNYTLHRAFYQHFSSPAKQLETRWRRKTAAKMREDYDKLHICHHAILDYIVQESAKAAFSSNREVLVGCPAVKSGGLFLVVAAP
jgi:hypothetical protein